MLKIAFRLLVISTLLSSNFCYSSKVELHQFNSPEQQSLYKKLSDQLRCLVCQNQNLADSNAELAQDMRNKTYQMVIENKTEKDIIDYWVARYGDFVLYKPPFKMNTLILWIGPFVLLLLALFIGFKVIKKSSQNNLSDRQKEIDHQQAQKLLDIDQ